MKVLLTVEQAKTQIKRLQEYVDLAESLQPRTFEEHVIKEYAYLGSITKVACRLNEAGWLVDKNPVEVEDVRKVLRKRGINDLHKIIRSGYYKRTLPTRRNT